MSISINTRVRGRHGAAGSAPANPATRTRTHFFVHRLSAAASRVATAIVAAHHTRVPF